jgi:hypothetical protein
MVMHFFSCWGMPALNVEQLNVLPTLKAVFYSIGLKSPNPSFVLTPLPLSP